MLVRSSLMRQFAIYVLAEYLSLRRRQAWHLLWERHMAGVKHREGLQRCAFLHPGQEECEHSNRMEIWIFPHVPLLAEMWQKQGERTGSEGTSTGSLLLLFPSLLPKATFPGVTLFPLPLALVYALTPFSWQWWQSCIYLLIWGPYCQEVEKSSFWQLPCPSFQNP